MEFTDNTLPRRPTVRVNPKVNILNTEPEEDEDRNSSGDKVESVVSCEAWKCRRPLHSRTVERDEFFPYLYSDSWDAGCILRISEGKLLDELLTALYLLLTKGTLVTHSSYAYARDVPTKMGGYAGKTRNIYQNLVLKLVYFGRLCKDKPNQVKRYSTELLPTATRSSLHGSESPECIHADVTLPSDQQEDQEQQLCGSVPNISDCSRTIDSEPSKADCLFSLTGSRDTSENESTPGLNDTWIMSSAAELGIIEHREISGLEEPNNVVAITKSPGQFASRTDFGTHENDNAWEGKEIVLQEYAIQKPMPEGVEHLFRMKKQQLQRRKKEAQDQITEINEALMTLSRKKGKLPPISAESTRPLHLQYDNDLPDNLPNFESMVKILKKRDPRYQNIIGRNAKKIVKHYTHMKRKQDPLKEYLEKAKEAASNCSIDMRYNARNGGVVHGVTFSTPCKEHYVKHNRTTRRPQQSQTWLPMVKRKPNLAKSRKSAEHTVKKNAPFTLPTINLIMPSETHFDRNIYSNSRCSKASVASRDSVGKLSQDDMIKTVRNRKVTLFTNPMFPKAKPFLDDESMSEDLDGNIDQAEIDEESKFDTSRLNYRHSFEELHKRRRQKEIEKFLSDQETRPTVIVSGTVHPASDKLQEEEAPIRSRTLPDIRPDHPTFGELRQADIKAREKRNEQKRTEMEDSKTEKLTIGKLRQYKFNKSTPGKKKSTNSDGWHDTSKETDASFMAKLLMALDDFVVMKEMAVSDRKQIRLRAKVCLTFTRKSAFIIHK